MQEKEEEEEEEQWSGRSWWMPTSRMPFSLSQFFFCAVPRTRISEMLCIRYQELSLTDRYES